MKRFNVGLLIVAAIMASVSAYAQTRSVQLLGGGWRFTKGDPSGAQSPGFDDSAWSGVSIPHTWNVDDGARGGDYYRGPGWYRLHLDVTPEMAGRSLFLRFGAAALVSKVYVNGEWVGDHAGGFSAFCFEVTKWLKPGDNVVAVLVDNSIKKDVTPLSGDFTVYGGLYREVKLLVLNPVSISPLDDASSGVYLTPEVNAARAKVQVATVLRNGSGDPARVTVTTRITDAAGMEVKRVSAEQTIAPYSSATATEALQIARPHLWDGVRDPYLYHATVEVWVHGHLVDSVEQPLGLRYFTVDPEKGFLLNGKPYDVHGVNIHQGRPSVGWASTPAMEQEDYDLVAELGATGLRMPHYQHAENEYTQCDHHGFVVWAELALVNKVTDTPEFYDNAKQQLTELIKQDYNHPSIFFWSMYNEPWVDKEMPEHSWRIVKELVSLSHQLDPTRLTTGAATIGVEDPLDWDMDIASFNRYWGWYSGEASQWESQLADMRQGSGGRSFGMSEYGAGASVYQHENHPAHPKTGGHWHPEEWQAEVHEQIWPVLADKPWLWCKFVWVMFDFGSAWRNEGDHGGINDKGLVTGDRKIKKDAFYYYKACWTTAPFVYVTDRRFSPRPAGPSDLKVYSNCSSVELFLNGKSLGVQQSGTHVFVWPNVDLAAGPCEVVAHGVAGGKVEDKVSWDVR